MKTRSANVNTDVNARGMDLERLTPTVEPAQEPEKALKRRWMSAARI
jgi:hypothetical protein